MRCLLFSVSLPYKDICLPYNLFSITEITKQWKVARLYMPSLALRHVKCPILGQGRPVLRAGTLRNSNPERVFQAGTAWYSMVKQSHMKHQLVG